MNKWGLVNLYLLKNELGRYKIGISSDVKQRVRTISLGGGLDVSVIKTWKPIAACHVEELIHHHFRKNRHLGEWFQLSSSPEEFIDRVVADELRLCKEHSCLDIVNRKDSRYRVISKSLNDKFNKEGM